MRRIFVWLSLLLALFAAAPNFAAAEIVRVGYVPAPNFLAQDAAGHYRGTAFGYLEALSAYAGCSFSYKEYAQRDEALAALFSGDVDLLVGATGNRRPGLLYSQQPVAQTTLLLSLRQGRTEMRRLGYLAPLFDRDFLTRSLTHTFPQTRFDLTPYPSYAALEAAQKSGALDGVLSDTLVPPTGLSPAAQLAPLASYLAYLPKNAALKGRIDAAADDLAVAAPDFSERLASLEGRTAAPLLLTQEEKDFLASHPHFRAFASPAQVPFSYFEDGEHRGIVHDIIARMESDLGIQFDIRETAANDDLFRRLDLGEAEVMTDFFADFNWAHEHRMRITVPYLQVTYVLVHRRGEPPAESPVIAAPRSRNFTRQYIEKNYPAEKIRYYATDTDCLRAVSRGEADVCAVKGVNAQTLITEGGFYRLEAGSQVVYRQGTALAVSEKIDPIFIRILNKEIAHLSDEDVRTFVNQETAQAVSGTPLFSFLYRYPTESVTVLALVFLLLLAGVFFALRVRRSHMDEVTQLAYYEPVTGLHNERWWEKELLGTLLRLKDAREKGALYLGAITVHRFAYYRSTYARETLLKSFLPQIERLPQAFPWFLLPAISNDRTCLFFLANLEKGGSPEAAARSIASGGATIPFGDVLTRVEYHIGFLPVPKKELNLPQLMSELRESIALARAKDLPFVLFDESRRTGVAFAARLEKLAPKALARQEFEVWYQPKYDLAAQKLVGAEALVRWRSPELGFLNPGKFVDEFERTGFAVRLDYYMLGHVQRFLMERVEANLPIVPVSVNQSALHMTERGYLKKMKRVAAAYKLPKGAVDLELTETAFVDFKTKEARESSREIIDTLKSYGFTMSMDDFCTGYSSIAMLQNLPMDTMKIDRSILLAAEKDKRAEKILKNVIDLGQSLSMHVLCEGIETPEQEQLLQKLGCTYGQGFLYAKPMPQAEFEKFMDERL